MHGHGYVPPPPRPPSSGTVVTLRVILVALPLMTCGFLPWPATLRAALVTRRKREWWAFAASIVIWTFAIALMSTDNTESFTSPAGSFGLILLLLNGLASAIYFLVVDIGHYGRPLVTGNVPPQQMTHMPPQQTTLYGYPQAPSAAQPPGPQPPTPQPYAGTPVPGPPQPQSTPTPPPPQRPAPARIDQVRAELDELSDYLRKHEDGR
ncbi:hypothetical protein ACQEVY_17905 [Streptomyces sp. CA-288835]|uniref:hypothetical protein n=1 Tax=Streptomyces sp. CA-288835 TaxID=3240069 RepID=UPI003D8DFA29